MRHGVAVHPHDSISRSHLESCGMVLEAPDLDDVPLRRARGLLAPAGAGDQRGGDDLQKCGPAHPTSPNDAFSERACSRCAAIAGRTCCSSPRSSSLLAPGISV